MKSPTPTISPTILHLMLCALFAFTLQLSPTATYATTATTSPPTISSAINVNSFTLENGLHVIHHYRPYSNSVALQVVIGGGLDQYSCDKQQTPHVLEQCTSD